MLIFAWFGGRGAKNLFLLFIDFFCIFVCGTMCLRFGALQSEEQNTIKTNFCEHTHTHCVYVCVCTEMCVYIGMSIIMTIMITDCFYVAGGG